MAFLKERMFFSQQIQESTEVDMDTGEIDDEANKDPVQDTQEDPDELDLENMDDSMAGHGPLSPGFEGDTTIYQSASESLLSEPERNVEQGDTAETLPEGDDEFQGENDDQTEATNNEEDSEVNQGLINEISKEEEGIIAETNEAAEPSADLEKGENDEGLDISLGKEGLDGELDHDLEKEPGEGDEIEQGEEEKEPGEEEVGEESEERRQKQLDAERYGTEPVSSDDDLGNHDDHVELDYDEGDLDDGERIVVETKHPEKVV